MKWIVDQLHKENVKPKFIILEAFLTLSFTPVFSKLFWFKDQQNSTGFTED